MEPTSVGLCYNLINATATLAFNVRQIIAELENAGGGFKDVVDQLTVTSMSLVHLKYLFENTALPPYIIPEFTRQLQKCQSNSEDIDTSLKQLIRSPNHRPFLRRHPQERSLAGEDLWRLSNKILSFNQNLNLTLSTYNCAVIGLVYGGVNRLGLDAGRVEPRVESGVSVGSSAGRAELAVHRVEPEARRIESRAQVSQDKRVDIGYQYIEAERRSQQDWDKMCVATTSTNDSVGMGGWNVKRKLPPRPPPTPTRTQDKEIWCKSVPSTNTGMDGYFIDSRLHPKLATRGQVEETQRAPTPSLRARASGFFTGSKPQSTTSLNLWKGDEDSRSVPLIDGYGLGVKTLDLSDAQRIQDEEWRVWEQKRRDASTRHEM